MKKHLFIWLRVIIAISFIIEPVYLFAQSPETAVQQEEAPTQALGNITLDFKQVDITNVLRAISHQTGINIITDRDVKGLVTIKLIDVPWEEALDMVLKTCGYGYERKGNILIVTSLEKLTLQKEREQRLGDIQPVETEVFQLRFIDASDAKKVLEPQLSPRGKISILEVAQQKGWVFGATGVGSGSAINSTGPGATQQGTAGAESSKGGGQQGKSRTLVVSDIPPYMEKIRKVIATIDKMPKQILIETKIIEVDSDKLKDIGFDWGTGNGGAESSTMSYLPLTKQGNLDRTDIGGHTLGSQVTPSIFSPKATSITGLEPYNTGLELVFKKVIGDKFEVMFHALVEKVGANLLSVPKIMTLDGQAATILIGQQEPILKSDISASTSSTAITQSLDYYQNIGIQLNVVPQISGDNYINMLIHPAVYSYTTTKTATSVSGDTTVTTLYPVIEVREAETQVLMCDGETIVMGGLLKDVNKESVFSVPFLGDIPFIGHLFKRTTNTTTKVDLLIFITATVINPDTSGIAGLEQMKERSQIMDIARGLEIDKALVTVSSSKLNELKGWVDPKALPKDKGSE